VAVRRDNGVVTIEGHMWPSLPAVAGWLPDGDLESKLHVLDTTPDLLPVHRYARVFTGQTGPLEIREALCLYTAADAIDPPESAPARPCVDARTGENLTARLAGWRISSANGGFTRRAIVHPTSP
jgi:hypothetical protein